jgi:hypothetical protein
MNADTLIALPQSFPDTMNIGRLGRCMNQARCDLALSGQVLVIEDRGQFLCPSCGGPLASVSPRKAPSHHGRSAMIMAGSFAAAVALGLAVAGMELSGGHSNGSAATAPAAPSLAPSAARPAPTAASAPPQARPVNHGAPASGPVEQADLPEAIAPVMPVEAPPLRDPAPSTLRASPVQARPLPAPHEQILSAGAARQAVETAPALSLSPPRAMQLPQPHPAAAPIAHPLTADAAPALVRPGGNAQLAAKPGLDRPFSSLPVSGGQPSYPDALIASGTRGIVNISCRIEADGRPTGCQARTVRGNRAFSNAVAAWLASGRVRFAPILRNGTPVTEQHAWNVVFDPGSE